MIPPDDFQLDLELEPEPVTKSPHADKTPIVNNQNIESVQDKSEIKADKTQYAQKLETQIIQDSTPEKNFFEVEKSAFIPEVKSDPLVHNEEKVDQVHKENAAPDSDIQSDTDEKYVSASKRLSVSIIGYKAVSVTDDKTVSKSEDKSVSVTDDISVPLSDDKAAIVTANKSVRISDDKAVSVTDEQTVSVTDERPVSKSEDKSVSLTDEKSVPISDDKAAIVTVDKSAPVSDDKAESVTVDKSVSKSEDKAVTENESALGPESKPALNIREFNSVPIPDTSSESTLKGKSESTKQEEKLIIDEQEKLAEDKTLSTKEPKPLTINENKTDKKSEPVEIHKENESLQDDKTVIVQEDQPKSELPDKIKEVETPKSPQELILAEIIDLAKNSCDEIIKEAIPVKVENLRKILDEKPVAPAAPPPSAPPPPPPAPPPPAPKPAYQLKMITRKNNNVELTVKKKANSGPSQSGDLMNELKNAFRKKLKKSGSVSRASMKRASIKKQPSQSSPDS